MPLLEALEDRMLLSVMPSNLPSWQELGPGPIYNSGNVHGIPLSPQVGAVNQIAADPSDADHMYAATVNGGIWERHQNFQGDIVWDPLTDELPSLSTATVALSPLNSNWIFAGTADVSSFDGLGGPAGYIYQSTDGGQTWSLFNYFLTVGSSGTGVTRIVPTRRTTDGTIDTETILAATTDMGVFRSEDGGATWTFVLGGTFNSRNMTLAADPGNANRFFAAGNGGVWESDDYGATWHNINHNLVPLGANIFSSVIDLATYAQGGTDAVYGAFLQQGTGKYIVTRAQNTSDPNAWSVMDESPEIGSLIAQSGFAVDPNNPEIVYVAGEPEAGNPPGTYNDGARIFRGDFGAASGEQWLSVAGPDTFNGSSPHADSRDLTFDVNGNLINANDGGVYRMTYVTDSGGNRLPSWSSLNDGLRDTEFFSVAYDSTFGVVLGGSQDNGTAVQSPGDTTWFQPIFGAGDGGVVAINNSGPVPIYFYSSDGFKTFTRNGVQVQLASGRIPTPFGLGFDTFGGLDQADQMLAQNDVDLPFPYVLNRAFPSRMLLGNNGVYESVSSDAFGAIDTGDVIREITPSGMVGVVTALAYGTANNPDAALVGTGDDSTGKGALFIRTAAGAPFQKIVPTDRIGMFQETSEVRSVLFDQDDYHIAFVLYANGHIWETTNAGAPGSWIERDGSDSGHNIMNSLSSLSSDIRTLELYDPTPGSQPGDGVLLAGGLGGVFRLTLGTLNPCWRGYGDRLPNVLVTDLHYYGGAADLLLAGTFGRGAWEVANASRSLTRPASLVVGPDPTLGPEIFVLRRDPSNPRFLQVRVGGMVEYDGPADLFSSITINGGSSQNSFYIEDIPDPCIAVTVVDESVVDKGTVYVGNNFDTSDILGSLTITNPVSTTALYIYDTNSRVGANFVTVTATDVTGRLVPGGIHFAADVLNTLDIQAPDATFFLVQGTPNDGGFLPTTNIILFCNGSDAVIVGDENQTILSVQGNLFIENDGGQARVLVNDSGDGNSYSSVTLDRYTDSHNVLFESLSGLGPGTIYVEDGTTKDFAINGSNDNLLTGTNTWTISDTAPNTPVTVHTEGFDNVNVLGTSSDLAIDADQGATAITIGNAGRVSAVRGAVMVTRDPTHNVATTVAVDDSADTSAALWDFSDTAMVGLGDAASLGLSYSGITKLDLSGGNPSTGSNTFIVLGTIAGTTTLNTGLGSDSVSVEQTAGDLHINGQAGTDSVTVGKLLAHHSGHVMFDILGNIWVGNAQGHTNLVLDNSGDIASTIETPTITANSVTGLGQGPSSTIYYTPGEVSSLIAYGSQGGNTFAIQGTGLGTMVSVVGGAGTDTFNVGNAANQLGAISGELSVDGRGGTNYLNVHDEGTSSAQTYEVFATQLLRFLGQPVGNPTQTINYFNINHVYVHGGTAANLWLVESTMAGTTTDLYSDGGSISNANEFSVHNSANVLDAIQGSLALHGGGVYDFVVAFDAGNNGGNTGLTYTLSNAANIGKLQRDGMADITYDGIGEFNLYTANNSSFGHTPSTINVLSLGPISAGVAVGTGDTVTVGQSGTLANILADLVIAGGGLTRDQGLARQVTLDDSADTMAHTMMPITLGSDSNSGYVVNGLANSSQGGGIITLRLDPVVPVSILGGLADDDFRVHDFTNAPAISIDGGGGTNTLSVSDQATTSQNWDVASSFIDHYPFGGVRPAVPQISYHSMATVTVNAGTAQDFIFTQSTHAGTTTIVNGGGGNGDYFFVENISNSLDDIQGLLQTHDVNPYNLLVTDGGSRAPHTYTVTSGQLQRDGIQPITFDSDVALVLDASAGGGTVNVPSFGGTGVATIVAKTLDTVTVGSQAEQGLSGITADVVIEAALGQTPHVVLDDSANMALRTFDLSSAPFFGYLVNGHNDPIRGRIGLVLDPAAPVSIWGGGADDVFRIHDFTAAPAITIDAEHTVTPTPRPNMHNQLDYSAYTGTVKVNLPLGTATGFAGISHIQDVTGGIGNNLLVGDANPNILIGGNGRNIIIGGNGSDRLIGGGGENILIGGTTAYDSNSAALDLIMQEWLRNDLTFSQRVRDIMSGGSAMPHGVPPSALLGTGIKLSGATVFGDSPAAADSLTGGPLQNWFFIDSDGDTITNRKTGQNGDTVTQV